MHPYAGDPTDFPLTVDLIDDSDAPNASNFDVGPQGALDRTAYLVARFPLPGFEWCSAWSAAPIQGGTNIFAGAGAWDPFHAQWLWGASANIPGNALIFATYGQDEGAPAFFTQIGSGAVYSGANNTCVGVGVDHNGTGFWAAVCVPGLSEVLIQFTASASSAWGNKRTVSNATIAGFVTFNGYTIYWTDEGILSSTANQGSTWSDHNTTLAGTDWIVAAAGVAVVALGSGGSVYTSTDGVTWTTQTLALGTNHSFAGLAWDSIRGVFVAAVNHTSTPYTGTIWTSPDGVTWTQVSNAAPGQIMSDFAVVSGAWVATLLDLSSGGPSGIVVSNDGGTTWFVGPAWFPTNNAPGSQYVRSRIKSSPQQLFAFNGLWGRFSRLSGLPAVHL